jgi:hypothetical protein
MLKYQIIVEIDMECAVAGRHQAAPANGITELMEDFARYPSGPERLPSEVAVANGNFNLVLSHPNLPGLLL